MRQPQHLWSALFLAAIGASCSAPDPRASDEQIALLASDAHVVVGGTSLTLPFVALPEYISEGASFSFDRRGDRERAQARLATFRSAASQPSTAPSLDRIMVHVGPYGWDDFGRGLKRICPRLSRRWSRSVCDDPWAPVEQALPANPFYLVDVRGSEDFALYGLDGQLEDDRFPDLRRRTGQVSVFCDKPRHSGSESCKASVLITDNLGAVWTVWDDQDSGETRHERADREARGIRAFVIHGAGRAENFPALLAAACVSKEPGSAPPDGVDPCSGVSLPSG